MPDVSIMSKPPTPAAIIGNTPTVSAMPEMRMFGDSATTRKFIYDDALKAAAEIEPISNDQYTLKLTNPSWVDKERFTRKERKEAVLRGETLARRMKATWELYDKAGTLLDKRDQVVARIPYLSSMGTFVHRGNEYTVNHQQRLLPGVFARVKDNGELESHFNILPGKGVSHRYFLDPAKGIFKVKFGQSEMPLMPLLQAMGATDREIREAWGDQLWQANYAKNDPSVIKKLAAKLVSKKDLMTGDSASIRQKLVEKFAAMELDPDVTQRTLGQPVRNVTKEAILAATKKLLQVNKGEVDPDDRDHLAYQKFYGPEDLFAERIRRDHGQLRRQLFWKMAREGNLKRMPSGALTPQVEQVLLGSGLAQALEEINPAEVFDKQTRITRLGEGGIPNAESIPDEARAVQPSHMGFMDPVRTPECYDRKTEVMTRYGWKAWPDVTKDDELACLIDGRLEWHRAEALHVSYYFGELYGVKTSTLEYLVTPNHRLNVRPIEGNGKYRIETAEESFLKPRCFATGHSAYVGEKFSWVDVPEVEIESNNTNKLPSFPVELWASLVGWYLGEGLTIWRDPPGDYRVCISQSKTANRKNCDEIGSLLTELGLTWSYNTSMQCFVVCGKQLTSYFRQFGYSHERYIPEDLMTAPVTARRALLDSLLKGEGRKNRSGKRTQFCSTSIALAEGVQRLAFSLGQPSVITFEKDDRQPHYHGCYVVHLHERTEREAHKQNYYKIDYADMVYCATVPGGLLYVRRGNTSGHWSGNSFRVGVDVHMARNSRKGRDGKIYTQLRDKSGKLVWKSPQDVADATVATPEILRDPFWKDMKRVPVMRAGKVDYVTRDQIEYQLPSFGAAFSPLANLIPFMAATKPGRVAMGSRYMTQALGLINGESPLVRAGLPGDSTKSAEEEYGRHMGAEYAEKEGYVTDVRDGVIKIRHPDGTVTERDLYQYHPFNRKTYVHQTPVVKPGDRVAPGQLLARSNYTDEKGAMALGANFNVAYFPYKGYNFEDAIVISESAAKRLTSEHMYQHDLEVSDKHKLGRNAYVSLFPGRYDKRVLSKLDERGLIKVGETVEYGDPLVLAAKEKDAAQNKIHKAKSPGYQDVSITWKHHDPGIVTDVVEGKNGPVVLVKSNSSMQIGDKMSGRYGDKGVVSAIIPDNKMPQDAAGNPFEILLSPDGIITRCYDALTEFLTDSGWKFGYEVLPSDRLLCFDTAHNCVYFSVQKQQMHSVHYVGRMLKFSNKVMDFCVTPNHKMWVQREDKTEWEQKVASDLVNNRYRVPVSADYRLGDCEFSPKFSLPVYPRTSLKDSHWSDSPIEIDAGDWAEFLGWYVAEGNVTWDEETCEYKTHIAQDKNANPAKCRLITKLLRRLPFSWHYGANNQFHLSSKRLAYYLKPLGLSHEKYIPSWVFEQHPEVRQRFLTAYWFGDGSRRRNKLGSIVSQASSTSRRLADDLQRLLVLQGESGAVYPKKERVECRPAWTVSRHTMRHRLLRPNGWTEIVYDGMIYCPTVSTGYVVTRRNGKVLIAGNTNPSQTHEMALGKLAKKLGHPINVPDFENEDDLDEWVDTQLKMHGIKSYDDVYWPEEDRKVAGIGNGVRFMMKLHHTAESKGQGRASGSYSMDETPAKGGETGSKRLALLDVNALMSHGAVETLNDAGGIRGQKNEDWWLQFMSGYNPPDPKIPYVYEQFVNRLKGSGINVVRKGYQTNVMALTNKDVDELSGDREIKTGDTVRFDKDMRPVKGGLFDEQLTGGHGGKRWAHIKLPEPLPNPVMEEPIRRILGLTQKEFEEVLSGDHTIQGKGTGPGAIVRALDAINLDRELAFAKAQYENGRGATRDAAVRRWGYLKDAKRLGLHPRDWVLEKAPVLPPAFRPVSVMGDSGMPLVSDANYLYKELLDANKNYKDMKQQVGEEGVGPERLAMYHAFKAITGLAEPVHPKLQEKGVKGLLKTIFGTSPKFGTVQRKLISSTVDNVGRAVITPDPDLDMDSVGLPEDQAFKIYEKFIVRDLKRRGMALSEALRHVRDKSNLARDTLVKEMEQRPVFINRAPVLHKFGIMAFRPQLVKGTVLKVSPLIVKGFNADFDGDAMQFHVPTTKNAVDEAYDRLLPSKSLLSPADFKSPMHVPGQQYQAGLFHATRKRTHDAKVRPRVFRNRDDAEKAYARGEITEDTPIQVME